MIFWRFLKFLSSREIKLKEFKEESRECESSREREREKENREFEKANIPRRRLSRSKIGA